jgi:hypothetical protein
MIPPGQWKLQVACVLVLAGVFCLIRDLPWPAVGLVMAGLVFFVLDTRQFKREDAIYQRESDERLERLRAHCETPPRGEEED